MKRRTRRVLFWVAVVIFAFASWIVVKYAQGYVYDFGTHMFVRTGAVAVTANTSATLVVNGQDVGSTSLFGNRAGDDRLKAGTYTIQLARDGYSAWRKVAVVQAGLLTDFPNAMILPTDAAGIADLKTEASNSFGDVLTLKNAAPKSKPPQVAVGDFLLKGSQLIDIRTASLSVIADHVLGMTMADDNSRILWWTQNELWVMWIRSTSYQPFRAEREQELLMRLTTPIVRATWFRDHDHIVVDLGGHIYRIIETDTRGGVNVIRL
jgi:hypothetical protein